MKFNYNGLWKILIDKEMKKKDLVSKCNISQTTIAKMGKGEPVTLTILGKICKELSVEIGDIVRVEEDCDE